MSFINDLELRFRDLNEALSFVLAILSLAVAFLSLNPLYFGISVLTATTAIVPHEIAHRQSARSYGCNSRFVLSFKGFTVTLLVNLLSSILHIGILIFVSGFTAIFCRFGYMGQELEGKTAFFGPLTNLIIAFLALISLGFIHNDSIVETILSQIFAFNAYVAFFNLIPIPPLDGFKVFRWNKTVWIAGVLISFVLTFLFV
ncbi:peptidase M50 [Stygiolobus caldivivus]|uniref:Peptidase M50 n=1 Tax=Stygiolobus caldivivus TaxID=2824673 RepID=A0A8D5U7R7_9CREN|nr:peptidase M50 [Stygiolobus caldivivus]BCU70767.1 peptidase M50 [Stygiolobus caldivivus]